MNLFLRDGTVLHSLGNDEELARAQHDVSFSHLDGETPFQHQEEVIRFFVGVPDERASRLDDHEVVAVELADRPRFVALREGGEFFRKVDLLHL